MNRFMTVFIGTAAAKPKKQQQQQPKLEPMYDVTFVQPEKRKNDFVSCHACGFTHKVGLDNCTQISEPAKARIKKLVKNSVFNGAYNNAATTTAARKPTKQKRGTANVVVEEQDNREETEVEEDGMPT